MMLRRAAAYDIIKALLSFYEMPQPSKLHQPLQIPGYSVQCGVEAFGPTFQALGNAVPYRSTHHFRSRSLMLKGHLAFHSMNRSGADAQCFSRFEDSCPGRQLFTHARHDIGAHGATPEALPLCSGTPEAQVDAPANDRPLELCECASYLVEQASCRRRGGDGLLIQAEIDPDPL